MWASFHKENLMGMANCTLQMMIFSKDSLWMDDAKEKVDL